MRKDQTTENTQIFKGFCQGHEIQGRTENCGTWKRITVMMATHCNMSFLSDLIRKRSEKVMEKLKFNEVCSLADSILPILISNF